MLQWSAAQIRNASLIIMMVASHATLQFTSRCGAAAAVCKLFNFLARNCNHHHQVKHKLHTHWLTDCWLHSYVTRY